MALDPERRRPFPSRPSADRATAHGRVAREAVAPARDRPSRPPRCARPCLTAVPARWYADQRRDVGGRAATTADLLLRHLSGLRAARTGRRCIHDSVRTPLRGARTRLLAGSCSHVLAQTRRCPHAWTTTANLPGHGTGTAGLSRRARAPRGRVPSPDRGPPPIRRARQGPCPGSAALRPRPRGH